MSEERELKVQTNNVELIENSQFGDFLTIHENGLNFRLEIFEGPLDLLLNLIAKNKVNIYDIPISLILEQYMDYLHKMELFNLEIASEFIVMAAQLMVIKSRLMLPKAEDDCDDPRDELVDLLFEYKRAKLAAEILHEREPEYSGRFEKPPSVLELTPEQKVYSLTHEISLLNEAYRRVYERNLELLEQQENSKNLDILIKTTKHINVNDRINAIIFDLKQKKRCGFGIMFEKTETRNEIVATFLAILELVKGRRIRLENLSEDYTDCALVFVENESEGENLDEI